MGARQICLAFLRPGQCQHTEPKSTSRDARLSLRSCATDIGEINSADTPATYTVMRIAYLAGLVGAVLASAHTTVRMNCANSGRVADILASDLHSVLSHRHGVSHSVVPGAARAWGNDKWHHLDSFDGAHYDASVLFEPKKAGGLVVMHGGGTDALPKDLQETHVVSHTGPLADSLDALARLYVKSTRKGAQITSDISDYWRGHANIEHMVPESLRAQRSHAISALREEIASIISLTNRGGSLKVLRVSALKDVEDAFGSASAEARDARALVREALEQFVQAHPGAVTLVHTTETIVRRSEPVVASGAPRTDADLLRAFAAPVKAQSTGAGSSCAASAAELSALTNNCSGNGDAVETQKGGRKCFRCACKPSQGPSGTLNWVSAS